MQLHNNDFTLSILLATYNGELYLREQLDSLFSQTFINWNLCIMDDGSTDSTLEIVSDYMTRFTNIYLFKDETKKQGAKETFFYLLNKVNSDYYMFCDQDDIWLPDKIEKTLQKMFFLEDENSGSPILINTDLIIVNKRLEVIESSLWNYSKINPHLLVQFKYLAVCNFVTGCTMMINQKVKNIVFPIPEETLMHDAWIALKVINDNGIIGYINEGTILYRLHGNNVVGIEGIDQFYVWKKIKLIKEVIRKNRYQFRMLNKIKKYSLFQYIKYKILYFFKR